MNQFTYGLLLKKSYDLSFQDVTKFKVRPKRIFWFEFSFSIRIIKSSSFLFGKICDWVLLSSIIDELTLKVNTYCFMQKVIIRGSFRTGSTGSWEPVNFEKSYAEVRIFDKHITEYLTISWMQNSGTRQFDILSEPLIIMIYCHTLTKTSMCVASIIKFLILNKLITYFKYIHTYALKIIYWSQLFYNLSFVSSVISNG